MAQVEVELGDRSYTIVIETKLEASKLLEVIFELTKNKESVGMRTDEITSNAIEREVNNQSSTTINQYNNRTEQNNVDNSTRQEAPSGSIGSENPSEKFREIVLVP